MKNFIVVKKPLEEEVVRDPVQVGRKTKETLRGINVSVAVAHVPIVSPLARDLILHGLPKTLGNLRKINALEHAGKRLRLPNC